MHLPCSIPQIQNYFYGDNKWNAEALPYFSTDFKRTANVMSICNSQTGRMNYNKRLISILVRNWLSTQSLKGSRAARLVWWQRNKKVQIHQCRGFLLFGNLQNHNNIPLIILILKWNLGVPAHSISPSPNELCIISWKMQCAYQYNPLYLPDMSKQFIMNG